MIDGFCVIWAFEGRTGRFRSKKRLPWFVGFCPRKTATDVSVGRFGSERGKKGTRTLPTGVPQKSVERHEGTRVLGGQIGDCRQRSDS